MFISEEFFSGGKIPLQKNPLIASGNMKTASILEAVWEKELCNPLLMQTFTNSRVHFYISFLFSSGDN